MSEIGATGPPRVFTVTTHDGVAVRVDLTAAKLLPRVRYPGSLWEPWPVECERCTLRLEFSALQISRGAACPCAEPVTAARRAGYEPQGPCPRNWREPWPLYCPGCDTVCTTLTPRMLLDDVTPCPHVCDAAQAEAETAGMVPLAPYPGTPRRPWRLACVDCEAEREVSLLRLRGGWRCRHAVPLGPDGEMLEAGFMPLEDFPGLYAAWSVRCLGCGRQRRKKLYDVRRDGSPCAHSKRDTTTSEKDMARYAFQLYASPAQGD